MKILKSILALAIVTLSLTSCSSDGDGDTPAAQYAMTAKVNGTFFQMNNVFGTNAATTTIWDYYPSSEYIRLQGSFGAKEINIWIKRTDLVVGSYHIGYDTDGVTTHADLIDLSTSEYEETITGNITITAANATAKTVSGTFNFTCAENPEADVPVVNNTVTEGTFNYRYDVN